MSDKFFITVGAVDNVVDIVREVAQWCKDSGNKSWNPNDITRDYLLDGLSESNFIVGKIGKDNASCMILQWQDILFWPEAKENESGYIHKLCVRRKYAGKGLSQRMVEFAVEECKKRKINCLRLDTGWHKEKLCRLYENLGFTKVGKRIIGDNIFALYEMKI